MATDAPNNVRQAILYVSMTQEKLEAVLGRHGTDSTDMRRVVLLCNMMDNIASLLHTTALEETRQDLNVVEEYEGEEEEKEEEEGERQKEEEEEEEEEQIKELMCQYVAGRGQRQAFTASTVYCMNNFILYKDHESPSLDDILIKGTRNLSQNSEDCHQVSLLPLDACNRALSQVKIYSVEVCSDGKSEDEDLDDTIHLWCATPHIHGYDSCHI